MLLNKVNLDPIVRFLNLQLQRLRWSRLEGIFKVDGFFKAHQATPGVVNFYNAGAVGNSQS
jgi:hypothetical protein